MGSTQEVEQQQLTSSLEGMDPYMLLFSRSSTPYVIPISVPIPQVRQSVPLKPTTHEHGRRQVNTATEATHCV